MATLNDIDLGLNTRWTNEFEGSAFDREAKYTEDGKKFVFQKRKQHFKNIIFDCTGEWLLRDTAMELVDLRDSGSPALFTHNDGRTFNVLLELIDGLPKKDLNKHSKTSKFKLVLHFMEI